jgi:hypothetical protein
MVIVERQFEVSACSNFSKIIICVILDLENSTYKAMGFSNEIVESFVDQHKIQFSGKITIFHDLFQKWNFGQIFQVHFRKIPILISVCFDFLAPTEMRHRITLEWN